MLRLQPKSTKDGMHCNKKLYLVVADDGGSPCRTAMLHNKCYTMQGDALQLIVLHHQ